MGNRIIAAMLAAVLGVAAPAWGQDKIDLKLLGLQDVAGAGCSLALWQANRDPVKDRYAVAFVERFAADRTRQPATMKIGDGIVEFRRVATGGREKDFKTFEYQLYKSVKDDYTAILDIRFDDAAGSAVQVKSGSVELVTPGKLPFRVAVKGALSCAAVAPTASDDASIFQRYEIRPNLVPRALIADAQKRFGCKPEMAARVGITAYQLSEESGLWEIPCDSFAYSASSVIANVHVERPAEYQFIDFKAPPGRKRDEPFVLLNGKWNEKARTVASYAPGRGQGDCGTYEIHKIVDARAQLVEFREKKECDGRAIPPEQWPIVYRAR
jgi:hypothetical protein